ncbi:MAG: gliding motility-associated ABC transporter ATP-binding subunit GldA [Cytophagaceae bacterium]
MSVSVTNLTKTYGIQNAVDNISFEAGKGQIVGFLGPNGAGKSTTMKISTCYIPPTSGTVHVCGYDVVDSPMDVRRNIGYLPEHNPLYLDMYVHEYLHFIASLHGIKNKGLRVKEMVGMCGLTVEQNKKIGALSKGYRQRVGLAQAMIHDPQVLILDEPTTGLDPNQILEIRNLIREVGKEKTVIFSTHIMQEVQALCERVIIINKGKIVANGSVGELKNITSSSRTILVEFDKSIDTNLISAIDGVTEIKEIAQGKYEIRSREDKDIRSEIFKVASENKLNLLGLKVEENSLESIFQQLTKKKEDQ